MAIMSRPPPLSKDSSSGSTLSFRLGEQDDFAFSEELQRAVFSVLPSKDPLDDPSFNAVDFINGIFPDGSCLLLILMLLSAYLRSACWRVFVLLF